jgi:hypothetical protein
MAAHNISPVREQLRGEILTALACGEPMTTAALYARCPSAVDAEDVSRLAWELKRKGMIADGGKVPHPRGTPVNSYILATDPRIEASKPIKVERKIPRTIKPPKPGKDHPFKARIVAQEAHDALPRTTRPLPQHLQSTAPQKGANELGEIFPPNSPNHHQDEIMSQEPTPYIVNPAFALEPEAPEDIDSDLVSALKGLAEFVPLPQADDDDDVAAMASADVGEIAQALKEKKTPEPLLSHHANKGKVCQCIRLNKLPSLPSAYRYASISTEIISDNDCETLTLRILDEGDGPFLELDTTGRVRFSRGELAMISQAADTYIALLEETDHGR